LNIGGSIWHIDINQCLKVYYWGTAG